MIATGVLKQAILHVAKNGDVTLTPAGLAVIMVFVIFIASRTIMLLTAAANRR